LTKAASPDIQVSDLGVQVAPTAGQAAQRVSGALVGIGQVPGGTQIRACLDEFGALVAGEFFA
jgi:hypothetical protein